MNSVSSKTPLAVLAEQIQSVQSHKHLSNQDQAFFESGRWSYLTPAAVHEIFSAKVGPVWFPPLAIVIHIAHQLSDVENHASQVIWIGREYWPLPNVLARRGRLNRSVFVDPPDLAQRIWAIDMALRCPDVAAVVADGRGLQMAQSRRLQLAAASGRSVAMLVRPDYERRVLSVARSRMLVQPAVSASDRPQWTVEVLRDRDDRLNVGKMWMVEQDETGDVNMVADAAGQSAAASGSTHRARSA